MASINTKGLTSNSLKLIAMVAMTIDHFTSVVFPDYPKDAGILLMHIIGRLAAPIFLVFYCGRLFLYFKFPEIYRTDTGLHGYIPFCV